MCPIVLAVDGDMVQIVTPDGAHWKLPKWFLVLAHPAPDRVDISLPPISAEALAYLADYLKVKD